MARGKKDKLYRSFNKGLITEAGFLTYPEDASTDELNTILYKGGNRSRRYGIDFEAGGGTLTFEASTSSISVVQEYLWRSPNNKGNLNFLVLQVDGKLHFFDMSSDPLSEGRKAFTVDLTLYKSPTGTVDQIKNTRVSMASGKGILFVAQEYMEPITVEYDEDTDTISVVKIYILIRDFDGVYDGLANDAEPSVLSKEHHYNLRNQGWVAPGTPSVQTPTDPGAAPGDVGSGGTGGSSGVNYDPELGVPIYKDPFDTGIEE